VKDQISGLSRLWMYSCSGCSLQKNDSTPFSSQEKSYTLPLTLLHRFILPPCVTPARYPFVRYIAEKSERSYRSQSSSFSSSPCSSLQPLLLTKSVLLHPTRRSSRSLVSSTRRADPESSGEGRPHLDRLPFLSSPSFSHVP
jgi:hypothetical protein